MRSHTINVHRLQLRTMRHTVLGSIQKLADNLFLLNFVFQPQSGINLASSDNAMFPAEAAVPLQYCSFKLKHLTGLLKLWADRNANCSVCITGRVVRHGIRSK